MPEKKILKKIGIEEFCDDRSLNFFKILKLDSGFLFVDPKEWENNDAFVAARLIVSKLRTTNDLAERAVYLMTLMNQRVTHNWLEYEKLSINFYGKDLKGRNK